MSKIAVLFTNLARFNLKSAQFDAKTLKRLSDVDHGFILTVVQNLTEFGMKPPRIIETLQTHENWLDLNRESILDTFTKFRDLNIPSDISEYLVARNPDSIKVNKKKIEKNINDLKEFFTRNQLNTIMVKSPKLLTCYMDDFIYRFVYLYHLMGIKQDMMCNSHVFNHTIDYIRGRHLFLMRSGFYDKPDKRGQTKIENPLIVDIFDTKLESYLKICTNGLFNLDDFNTFTSYLENEDFDDELLGYNIGRTLRDTIIAEMKAKNKKETYD